MMRTQISDVLMPDGAREQIAAIMRSRLRKAGLRGPYAEADCDLGKRMAKLAGKGEGAYLWGEPGTGKTYAAACAVRLAVLDGTSAKLVTTSRLLDDIRSEYDGGERGALRRAERYRLLALDDLGAERLTEWAIETLTRLIDTRVAEGLPTIVTSNYRIGQIRDLWGGMAGKRVASRLAGACRPIEVKGQDRRLG